MLTTQSELSPIVAGKRKCSPQLSSGSHPSSRQMASKCTDSYSKRTRTKGPALPPPLAEQESSLSSNSAVSAISYKDQPHVKGDRKRDDSCSFDSNSDSSSDSDIGPAPPSQATALSSAHHAHDVGFNEVIPQKSQQANEPQRAERDAWMTMPPTQDDLSARFDPTKLRARKFNTGRGTSTTGASSDMGASSLWTETPEQKRKRLADEVMGVQSKGKINNKTAESTAGKTSVAVRGDEKDNTQRREIAEKIKDHAEKTRGPSLYATHQARPGKGLKKEEEDDPSSRPFNREKDIASGAQVGHVKRQEMIGRASDFGSKFSGGNFL